MINELSFRICFLIFCNILFIFMNSDFQSHIFNSQEYQAQFTKSFFQTKKQVENFMDEQQLSHLSHSDDTSFEDEQSSIFIQYSKISIWNYIINKNPSIYLNLSYNWKIFTKYSIKSVFFPWSTQKII